MALNYEQFTMVGTKTNFFYPHASPAVSSILVNKFEKNTDNNNQLTELDKIIDYDDLL